MGSVGPSPRSIVRDHNNAACAASAFERLRTFARNECDDTAATVSTACHVRLRSRLARGRVFFLENQLKRSAICRSCSCVSSACQILFSSKSFVLLGIFHTLTPVIGFPTTSKQLCANACRRFSINLLNDLLCFNFREVEVGGSPSMDIGGRPCFSTSSHVTSCPLKYSSRKQISIPSILLSN